MQAAILTPVIAHEFSPMHLACEMTRCSPDTFLQSKWFSVWAPVTIKKLFLMSSILQVCCAP